MKLIKSTLKSAGTLLRKITKPEQCLYDINNIIFRRKGQQSMVAELLPTGKENAVKSQKLADLIGCKSIRELQLIISEERTRGGVILSTSQNGGGYFLPENEMEVREFVQTLQNRGKHTLAALESAKAYLKKCEEEKNGK